MKLSEVLQLDCREKKNKRLLREALVEKLPFLSEYEPEDLSIEILESVINKMSKKYPITYNYINKSNLNEEYYSCMIQKSNPWEGIKTVYGISLFELFAKMTLFMYGYIKNNCGKDNN